MGSENALAALGALHPSSGGAQGADAKRAPEEIRKSAEEFEAVFLAQMASQMFTDIDGGMFSGGHAEDTYRSMLYQEFGKAIARAGGVGIADSVAREMIRMQEGNDQ